MASLHANGQPVTNTTKSNPSKETQNYAILCRLLVEGGTNALRELFDHIHPPLTLVEKLAKPEIHKLLRRLKVQGLINSQQWEKLYPKRKKRALSQHYDPTLLTILLKNICHLSPPYPNGWDSLPLHNDRSISAELARIQWFRNYLAAVDYACSDADFQTHLNQISVILTHLGGSSTSVKIQRIQHEKPSHEGIELFTRALHEWETLAGTVRSRELQLATMRRSHSEVAQLSKHHFRGGSHISLSHTPTSSTRHTSVSSFSPSTISSAQTTPVYHRLEDMSPGLTKEDRSVLLKHFKLLTQKVQSIDIVPKLVQTGILTHEEKSSINLAARNSDRMTMLLHVLPKKPPHAFDAFCDSIKYRNKGIYNTLLQTRHVAISQSKPDIQSIYINSLKSYYLSLFSAYNTIPWHPDLALDLQDFYIQPAMLDYKGRDISPISIFAPNSKGDIPRCVLVQGQPGTGKTTFCAYLCRLWTKAQPELQNFKMVFAVNLQLATPNLTDTLFQQCFPASFRGNTEELLELIEVNQKQVLFILDGYEDIAVRSGDFLDLLHRRIFPHCSLMVTASYASSHTNCVFDRQVALLGIQLGAQEALVHNYIKVTSHPHEDFLGLLAKLNSDYDITIRTLCQIPLFCLCMCAVSETEASLQEITSVTTLLQETILAIQKIVCQKHNITVVDNKIPQDVKVVIIRLEELALQAIQDSRALVDPEDFDSENQHKIAFQMGLLKRFTTGARATRTEYWVFTNRLLQDFLAASRLTQLEDEDFQDYKHELFDQPWHNVCLFFCGLLRFNYETRKLQDLFPDIAIQNRKRCKSLSFAGDDTTADNNENRAGGKIANFQLSLESLCECEGRQDLIKIVAQSLPSRLTMRGQRHLSSGCITGLAYAINLNLPNIRDLDLQLDTYGCYSQQAFMYLADAIEENTHIKTIKIFWSSQDLLAMFLAGVFGKNTTINKLLFYDQSHDKTDLMTATVWSNLRNACYNMENITTLEFLHCKNGSVVNNIIRNLPCNVQELSLTGCTINQISCEELAGKIEKSKVLRVLNLHYIKMESMNFTLLMKGLKHSDRLQELNLADAQLDSASYAGLAAALKFNKSLTQIDLTRAMLQEESCRTLGQALAINKSLGTLVLTGAKVTSEGKRLLQKLKRESLELVGLEDKGLHGQSYFVTRLSQSHPSLPSIHRQQTVH